MVMIIFEGGFSFQQTHPLGTLAATSIGITTEAYLNAHMAS